MHLLLNMIKFILIILTFNIVAILVSHQISLAQTKEFLIYEDSSLGIRIDYPAGWTHEVHPGGLVTFIASQEETHSNTYPAGVGIKVQDLPTGNISLKHITEVQFKNLTHSYKDFKLFESSESTLSGNSQARKIVFTATDDRHQERKAMQIWALKDHRAYLITYKAEPDKYFKYLPIFQKMVDSFQFMK
jgi:hypothetical protein